MVIRKLKKYDFSQVGKTSAKEAAIVIRFKAVPDALNGVLAESCKGFCIAVKELERSKSDESARFVTNYFFERERVRVIEASGIFCGESEPYTIGFPLYLAGEGNVEHEFAVTYDGVWFNIFCDGILYDRDSPDGGKLDLQGEIVSHVENTLISGDIGKVRSEEFEERCDVPIYCYTPSGFNTWAGDVVVASFKGVFHLFYLHDRHHHTSRKGRGAHMFCHLTSSNLVDWIEHCEVISFDKPYLTVGTGNSFVFEDKLYFAFGWHTERSKADEECAAYHLKKEFLKNGFVKSRKYEELGNIYPSGASYAVSRNGVDFVYSNKIIHYVENPNITVLSDGTLRLCEYGIWKGDDLDKWQIVDPDFPPRLKNSLTLNTTECPSFFTLNGTEYLMIGFTGFYRRGDDDLWHNSVEYGFEFYDGMAVPMAVEHDSRIIAGAWMNSPYWGSFLLLRELVPLADGGVGSRWIEETLPRGKFEMLNRNTAVEILHNSVDNMFTIESCGKLTVKFSDEQKSFYLIVDPEKGTASWMSNEDDIVEVIADIVKRRPDAESFRDLKEEQIHVWGENYSRRIQTEKSFSLRIIIHNEPKFQGAFVDVELDKKYTFATSRRDLKSV